MERSQRPLLCFFAFCFCSSIRSGNDSAKRRPFRQLSRETRRQFLGVRFGSVSAKTNKKNRTKSKSEPDQLGSLRISAARCVRLGEKNSKFPAVTSSPEAFRDAAADAHRLRHKQAATTFSFLLSSASSSTKSQQMALATRSLGTEFDTVPIDGARYPIPSKSVSK